jgi:hypothetical protein
MARQEGWRLRHNPQVSSTATIARLDGDAVTISQTHCCIRRQADSWGWGMSGKTAQGEEELKGIQLNATFRELDD